MTVTAFNLFVLPYQVCVSECPDKNEAGFTPPAGDMVCKEGIETVTEVFPVNKRS